MNFKCCGNAFFRGDFYPLVFLIASLPIERQEFSFFAHAGHGEAAVLLLLHVSSVDELLEDGGGQIPVLLFLLNLLVLLLEAVVFSQLVFDRLLLEELGLLVGLYFVLGTSALRSCLEQVRGHALAR